MLISNIDVNARNIEMPFGMLSIVVLGEDGRGRKELRLPAPDGCQIQKGLNADLTIGLTKNGRYRINNKHDNDYYLLLSSEGRYTRRGNGWIGAWVNNTCKFTLLGKGNGADGAAGRIGQWDVVLLKIDGPVQNEWFRIRTGGGGYGIDPQWLHVSPKGVFLFDKTEYAINHADMIDCEFPVFDDDTDITTVFKDVTY